MYKDLLVPLVLGSACHQAIDAACILAGAGDGHVTALVGVSLVTPLLAMPDVYPQAMYETLDAAARDTAARLRTDADARLAMHAVAGGSQVAETPWLSASEIAVVYARYADLVVLGRGADALPEAERTVFGQVLLHSGRPLLLVPQDAHWSAPPAHVVLAWKPTAEATRALHDAMPLLRRAQTVHLLVVEPRVGERDHGELPGADIAAHLSRHGVVVDVVSLPRAGASAGEAILRHAGEVGAGLVVAGGYGHTRMREQVFGGATRLLFEQARIPVLFSH